MFSRKTGVGGSWGRLRRVLTSQGGRSCLEWGTSSGDGMWVQVMAKPEWLCGQAGDDILSSSPPPPPSEGRYWQSMATLSSILAWRIATDRGAWRGLPSMGSQSLTRLSRAQHLQSLRKEPCTLYSGGQILDGSGAVKGVFLLFRLQVPASQP